MKMSMQKAMMYICLLTQAQFVYSMDAADRNELNRKATQVRQRTLYVLVEDLPQLQANENSTHLNDADKQLISSVETWDRILSLMESLLMYNVSPEQNIAHLIKDKKIGTFLYARAKAKSRKYTRTMAWLAKNGLVNANREFATALRDLDKNRAEYWLAHGADIYAKNNEGDTTLMRLTRSVDLKDRRKIIEILLELGADPNIQDKDGNTPLLFMVHNFLHNNVPNEADAVAIINALLAYGARTGIESQFGGSVDSLMKKLTPEQARRVKDKIPTILQERTIPRSEEKAFGRWFK